MKKIGLLAIVLCGSVLFAFTNIKLGAITGKIAPVDGASAVWLINGSDTSKTEIVQGVFKFRDLKQGVYTLWIKGLPPYKDLSLPIVAVKDSSTTDVGEIKLQQ